MIFPVLQSPSWLIGVHVTDVSYRGQERMTAIDPGIKQADIRGVPHGWDDAGSKVINLFVLLRSTHLCEEISRYFWQTNFGDHAEDVY